MEDHRVNFDSESRDVLLLELSSKVALDECGLADSAVTDEYELELGCLSCSINHC